MATADLHQAADSENDRVEMLRGQAVAEIVKCIATHVYTIRVLSLTGFDIQVKQIVRTYIEYVELLALVCADVSVLDEFIASGGAKEVNEFWHRHLSKFKARKKRMLTSVLHQGLSPERRDERQKWHEEQSLWLSESAHPTLHSVLKSGQVGMHGESPNITPDEPDTIIGSLIYTFCSFADALEVPTVEYLQRKLDNDRGKEICSRFYMIIMLAVLIGYRKDFMFFGKSQIDQEFSEAMHAAKRDG